jgi:asparagine synthase (glutamine-hydrolysing)
MCGIFGAVGLLPPGALDGAAQALAHRGPDAEGRFVEGEVALVHRRLKIIDLSQAAAQPMQSEDGAVQVIFNGEIYNHRALRRELEAAGHVFRSRSDTEAIVHGYEAWGDGVVERLDGMFAFAVWDRARRRLLLARDRAGKKPLYYSHGAVFRFASTVEALHASGLPSGVALEALPFYLAWGYVPAPATLHTAVYQLAPASRLILEEGQVRTEVYWQPEFGVEPTADSFQAASGKVRQLVAAAVERRLESDVPLGAFLSGGIDSTIVVGLMAERLPRVRTFSIGFAGDARYDETAYARLAAQRFGTEHVEFTLEPSSFELVETLVRHHDGPFGDSSAIPTYVVSRLTRQHVTVALTGDGGDELFCGYERFLAAEASEHVPLPVRQIAARAVALLPSCGLERTLVGRARRLLSASALPLADRMARWNAYFFEPRALLRREVADALDLEAPLAWQRDMFARARGRATLARVLEHNYRTYLPYDLLVKADRTSMAHGLELRAPFLDTALVEYAASLPPGYLRRGLTTKRILKHAFLDLLPPAIRARGKMGFGVPLGTWFRGGLRAYLFDRLGPGARLDAYLDRAQVSRLLDEHARGQADHGQRLWALLTLEVWLRAQAEKRVACAA